MRRRKFLGKQSKFTGAFYCTTSSNRLEYEQTDFMSKKGEPAMVTLKDVAKRANVSVATVSCCLSGAKNVKAETKLRIMQAVEELNYIPNAAARELRQTVSNKIGLVLPDLTDPYFNGILRGILGQLHSGAYILNIAFSDQNAKEEQKKISELINANVAGLLVVTCQPDNVEFFRTKLVKYQIPTVFIHQKPKFDANYIGFDNYSIAKGFTQSLLEHGYTDVVLIMGSGRYSSEEACLRGVRDAFYDKGLSLPQENIFTSNLTKEGAFRTAMLVCHDRTPHAILSTSSQMVLGIKEALNLHGIRTPQDTLLATLGVESWNATNMLEGVFYSQRSADALGIGAANLLLDLIQDSSKKPVSISYPDNALRQLPDLPAHISRPSTDDNDWPEIRVMAFDSPSVRALEMLSNCYSKQAHVKVHFSYLPLNRQIPQIITDSRHVKPEYDVVYFDSPWTPYLESLDVLDDLTPLLDSRRLHPLDIYPNYRSNVTSNGKIIGLPIICGTQVMFYRRDLFEKPSVMKAYKEQFNAALRPPKTWHEYNQIAAFFTRSCNPASPTAFGTTIPCKPDEYLIPELMIRLWSYGARLWNAAGTPTLITPQVEHAYEILLDAFHYVPSPPLQTDAARTISQFCSGEVAMMIAFTDYASEIHDSIDTNIISNIGYAPIPGHVAMQAGRNLGINRHAQNKEAIYDYLNWVFQADTSCYYTILGGQSCLKQPYENSEIIQQYPWMELTRQPIDRYYSRGVPPKRGQKTVIPVNRFEVILGDVLRRVCQGMRIRDSLEIAQIEVEALFQVYGY